MSIINNANPGSSILILSTIDRYLKSQADGKVNLDILKQHLRPDTLPDSKTGVERYGDNLRFWLKQGLWDLNDNEISIRFSDQYKSLESRILKIIVETTADENNFFKGRRVEPFLLCITGLINQDQYSFAGGDYLIGGTKSNLPAALLQYANFDSDDIPNQSNESGHFLKWAEFLGFVEPCSSQLSENAYFLDPTRAIFPYLKEIFSEEKTLEIQDFIQKLVQYLPMFGEGIFVKYLEPLLKEPNFKQADNQISGALSHALFRLEAMNKISFEQKSDDINVMQLYVPEGVTTRAVSNISLRDIA